MAFRPSQASKSLPIRQQQLKGEREYKKRINGHEIQLMTQRGIGKDHCYLSTDIVGKLKRLTDTVRTQIISLSMKGSNAWSQLVLEPACAHMQIH